MTELKPLQLERFLPYRLSLLSNTISNRIAAEYQDKFGISMPEWRIMMVLAEYPGVPAEEVCRRTRIEKSVVSRSVASLLARRLLTRESDRSDRRRSMLALSETGHSVYDEVMPVARAYEHKLLSGLSASDRSTLNRLLNQLQLRARELVNQ